jgi:peroxiredoxin
LLNRPAASDNLRAEEQKAAETIFKLVEEAPADRVSFRFLTALMGMSTPAVYTKASDWMLKHHGKETKFKGFLNYPGLRGKAPDYLFEQLLEQKELREFHAQACIILANRNYHRAKDTREKTGAKLVRDKESAAAAIKYHERLKKDFPKEPMSDFLLGIGATTSPKAAAVIAEERLTEMRSVWVGLPRPVPAGEPAPALAGLDINGKDVKLSDFKGKVVLVRFMPAKFETFIRDDRYVKLENAMMKQFQGKPFTCIDVCRNVRDDALKTFIRAQKITWPVLKVQEDKTWEQWRGKEGYHIIDAQGNVRRRGWAPEAELMEIVDGLLREEK